MRFTKYPLCSLFRLPTVAGFEPSTWTSSARSVRPTSSPSSRACVGESFTPSMTMYSIIAPRPDFRLWYLRDSVSRPSVCEVPAAEGRSVARRSCVGACRDSAKPTFGASSASLRIEAGTPTVDTVTDRWRMSKTAWCVIALSAMRTSS